MRYKGGRSATVGTCRLPILFEVIPSLVVWSGYNTSIQLLIVNNVMETPGSDGLNTKNPAKGQGTMPSSEHQLQDFALLEQKKKRLTM